MGNEEQVLRALGAELNEARVFAFGLGSAVNQYLLDQLAVVGRGNVEYIAPNEQIEDAVQRFQSRAAFPLLVDLALEWQGATVNEISAVTLPDLYAGQPLQVLAKFSTAGVRSQESGVRNQKSGVTLRGRSTTGGWSQALDVEWPEATPDRPGWAVLEQIWAQTRIEALLREQRKPGGAANSQRDAIVKLSREYGVLSPYTAFVALEELRDEHTNRAKAQKVTVPVHLPQGTLREAFEPRPALPPGVMMASASMGGFGNQIAGAARASFERKRAPIGWPTKWLRRVLA
ncbi:hypothetical protein HC891_18895, partial [Candidatus Gracilibacteria bacterium]|nr:hypothetical protein [Candidatus Gracilibacteria bacterium]